VQVRSYLARRKFYTCRNWPICEKAGNVPEDWPGWPGGRQFALVLTHDVETARGMAHSMLLSLVEERAGFRSGFYFVPERYIVYGDVLAKLTRRGFEVGIHGLKHDGKLYRDYRTFTDRAHRINQYLNLWGVSGFRSPSMHHKLEWLHELNIKYDMSTFDIDPFEPQPDGVSTIFPFWVAGHGEGKAYLELPYTLGQDFTLFVLVGCRDIGVWKQKLDWIAERGGMALLDTHPDYMQFNGEQKARELYPVDLYLELLEYVNSRYKGMCWNALPIQVYDHCREALVNGRVDANTHLPQAGLA
jgi:peptidoglycan/xylan/chitin deacetylase (PgdA/CDA1 family)